MRGNLRLLAWVVRSIRSIPARAGEPACHVQEKEGDTVYPRGVRGNRNAELRHALPRRSIPARAGEPQARTHWHGNRGVYPRACGGTVASVVMTSTVTGLSPRVRGNLLHLASPLVVLPVYPRACGGTDVGDNIGASAKGLSPRVRGNHTVVSRQIKGTRSIPARAGEPSTLAGRSTARRVYPRACGGTDLHYDQRRYPPGLSPRVRGNRRRGVVGRLLLRSIPARAGEPCGLACLAIRRWVYPRACGGTTDTDEGDTDE